MLVVILYTRTTYINRALSDCQDFTWSFKSVLIAFIAYTYQIIIYI